MFCSKCGNEIQEGASFCSKCGASVLEGQQELIHPDAVKPEQEGKKTPKKGMMVSIVLIAVAVVLIGGIAGYFISGSLGNKQKGNDVAETNAPVGTPGKEASGENDKAEAVENIQENVDEIENPGEAVLSSSNVENLDFATEMKLKREQIRSKNKETLLEIINNANSTEDQKQAAVDAMIELTDIAEREAAAEMLLEAKGFTDVVVSITDGMADVVVNMGEVTDAKRAQVEDIVTRKANISSENITIIPI